MQAHCRSNMGAGCHNCAFNIDFSELTRGQWPKQHIDSGLSPVSVRLYLAIYLLGAVGREGGYRLSGGVEEAMCKLSLRHL